MCIYLKIIFSAFCTSPVHWYETNDTDERVDDTYPERVRVGSTIRPFCDTYYGLYTYVGPESITCQATGNWSEEANCESSNRTITIFKILQTRFTQVVGM